MGKNKKKNVNVDAFIESEAFYKYLIRKHERLTILLDANLDNRKDPSETDIILLHEEYEAYDRSNLPWNINYDKIGAKPPKQLNITDSMS